MAHGVIPPFSGHLVCRDFLAKTDLGTPVSRDLELLGEAGNHVVVVQEVAESLLGTLRRAYSLFLASGYDDIRLPDGTFDADGRRLAALLVGVVLGVQGAEDSIGRVLWFFGGARRHSWRVAINGGLNYQVQLVEDAVGELMREGAKDVFAHAPVEGGMDRLEMVLCRS